MPIKTSYDQKVGLNEILFNYLMDNNVLLSIKPDYCDKIISGEKKFEYRKAIFKKAVDRIFIYSTMPIGRIVGYFDYSDYISGNPQLIWEETNLYSGLERDEFFSYCGTLTNIFALKIAEFVLFDVPIDPYEIYKFKPPQNFYYL